MIYHSFQIKFKSNSNQIDSKSNHSKLNQTELITNETNQSNRLQMIQTIPSIQMIQNSSNRFKTIRICKRIKSNQFNRIK